MYALHLATVRPINQAASKAMRVTRIIRIHSPQINHLKWKIQRLDQTVTVAKYPKEAGTPEKWPRGADLCYTFGCIMNNSLRDSIQPAYSLLVAMKV